MKNYKHILVTVNLFNENEDSITLERAREIAQETGADLTLIHAIDDLRGCIAYGYPGVNDVEERLRCKASQAMAKLGEKAGIPLSKQLVRFGLPKPVILDVADQLGIDLIVVSNDKHTKATVKDVFKKATCDTLAVHTGVAIA